LYATGDEWGAILFCNENRGHGSVIPVQADLSLSGPKKRWTSNSNPFIHARWEIQNERMDHLIGRNRCMDSVAGGYITANGRIHLNERCLSVDKKRET
jgi:hypothetical protein